LVVIEKDATNERHCCSYLEKYNLTLVQVQGDHSPDTLKFPDISLTMCGTHAHVKWYS